MPKRNMAKELRQTLEALIHIQPEQYMQEALLSPLWTQLQLQNQDMLLNGTPEQSFTYYDWQKPVWAEGNRVTGQGGSMPFMVPGLSGGMPGMGGGGGMPGLPGMGGGGFGLPGLGGGAGGLPGLSGIGFDMPGMTPMSLPGMGGGSGGAGGLPILGSMPGLGGGMPGLPGMGGGGGFGLPGLGGGGGGGFGLPGLGGMFGGDDEPEKKLISPGYWRAQTGTRPASRGLLSMYEGDVNPALARMQSFTRGADIADVMRFGPLSRLAIRAANPENATLLDMMNEQATSELGMGADLDPALRRIVSQTIRGRQAGTMLSNGNAGAYDEALGMSMFGNDLRNQRRGFAGSVVGLNQSVYGDPFQAVLSRSSGMVPQAMNAGNQAAGISGMLGPKLVDPMNNYAQDLHNTNFNARVAAGLNADNNRAALIGAGISAIGGIAGGAAAFA